ncbi:amidase [Hwanghaeella grinnelliae]|uniref:Amidase n=1 Tax=Hwanghaeella grinnelliae TaxID=2500179 RepID=A0A437QTK3_9PROT|nr:amidase [Hwanghaeella grinnelliae]RVU37809.1 amidase [Hwanghaeella grinnelliae]
MKPLQDLARELATGKTTSRALVEECLAAIEASPEGNRAFIAVHTESARTTADAVDAMRKAGTTVSAYAGIPMSVKDLYGVRGETTAAGSKVLRDAAPEAEDCPTIARCRQAGFVFMGRTNMTEFAYSGLGLNPHYGTPRSPWDRETGRIPGGSSSGSAVSVADGMAAVTLGTDTGGSCRIPAAFCGITGYKPSAHRVPLDGILPLSFSLDSAGPLGQSVDCCSIVDGILSGNGAATPDAIDSKSLTFAIPQTLVLDGLDDTVARAFELTVAQLRDAGVTVVEIPFVELGDIPAANAKGGFAAAEAYAWHKELLAAKGADYDPRVGGRIVKGAEQGAADYIDTMMERKRLIQAANKVTVPFDAVITPTVPIVPPAITAVDDDEAYGPLNLLCLRNPSFWNFLDRCSISLPCHRAGDAPVGLMLTGERGGDAKLFRVAKTVETLLAQGR